MSITHLHVLAVALVAASQLGACSARADAWPAPRPQAALVAPTPTVEPRPAPQAPFDERPITPFETVGAASCAANQC